MSDKADVEHPLTPTREDQATSDESFSVISESAVADKPADSDESEWKNVSSDNSDDDQAKRATSHPLQQSSAIDVSAYSNDTWSQQQESSLLDAEGLPNAQDGDSGATTPVKEREIELDSDTSHIKGFANAGDIDGIADLEVEGQLPEWLNGEHYTIGPGTYDIRYTRKIEIDGLLQSATATFSFGHWFDGLPLANRFDFNGKRNAITYRSRLTCRRLVEKIRDHHGYAPPHPAGLFKTDSNQTMLVKFLKSAPKANKPDAEPCAARILAGIPGVDGRLFAQNYANHIQELDPFDLKPTRVLCWNEVNPAFKGYSSCPNGQYDPQTGEYINFTMEIGYQSTAYNFFSISDRNPKGSIIASVTAPTGYVHSFSLTPKYIVLVVFPLLTNTGAVKFAWNESIMDSFSFYPSEPTLFYVISRDKGQHLVTYRADACFAFHHVNAYEDGHDNINVDILCYKDATIAHQLTTENMRNPSEMKPSRLAPSELRRFVLSNIEDESLSYLTNNSILPTASGVASRVSSMWSYLRGTNATTDVENSTAQPSAAAAGWYATLPVASSGQLVQSSMELPQVNPLYRMHRHKYVYGVGFSEESDGKIWDSIIKTDIETHKVTAAWHQENCYPSEAVFIGRPSASADEELQEDDGVLVSIVLDSARATSFLLVLDASNLQVLAKAYLGVLVPLSFGRGSYRLRT
ncbi:betacarotene-monooxygenase [Lichtheimia corymbifera JMRC:FSU:9682]|uniref:Betacarotene-monooxygenase n=1 Tax=Lichtheimia corymbifera JMRC:FSU:9682 TaxID=1263082 RepID=A0A068SB36_9FUNG|nr:betacarotene-monooxygenase [Lichtheimia corymbifera JMRC:FSU:9682]